MEDLEGDVAALKTENSELKIKFQETKIELEHAKTVRPKVNHHRHRY